jgi:hypothetical protein
MVAIGYEWNHVAKFCNYPSGRAAMLSVSRWAELHDPDLDLPPKLPIDAPTRAQVAWLNDLRLPEDLPSRPRSIDFYAIARREGEARFHPDGDDENYRPMPSRMPKPARVRGGPRPTRDAKGPFVGPHPMDQFSPSIKIGALRSRLRGKDYDKIATKHGIDPGLVRQAVHAGARIALSSSESFRRGMLEEASDADIRAVMSEAEAPRSPVSPP